MAPWVERASARSEEHTSELQSRLHLVCRLLLEKKKNRATQRAQHHTALPRRGGNPRDPGRHEEHPVGCLGVGERRLRDRGPTAFLFFFNHRPPPGPYPLSLPAPLPI